MSYPWCLDRAIEVMSRVRRDQPQPFGFAHDALQVVLDPERHVDGAALRHGLQWLHEVVGVQLNDCSGTEQREYVSLQPAEYSLGVAGRPPGYHARVPVEHNAFEGATVDHGLSLGLLLGVDGIYAVGELLLDLEALAACVAQPDHRIAAEGGQSFAAIGFHLPESPAFAAVGLHKQVKTVAVEELVLALSGLCRATGGVCKRGSGAGHKGSLRYRNGPLSLELPLLALATLGIRRNAKTRKPARRRVFRGFQRFESFLWNLEWCRHQESNPGPTDYKSVALPAELYRRRGRHYSQPPPGVNH